MERKLAFLLQSFRPQLQARSSQNFIFRSSLFRILRTEAWVVHSTTPYATHPGHRHAELWAEGHPSTPSRASSRSPERPSCRVSLGPTLPNLDPAAPLRLLCVVIGDGASRGSEGDEWLRRVLGNRRRVHPPTVHTLLLSSPVGLDLKLAIKGLENSLKLVA